MSEICPRLLPFKVSEGENKIYASDGKTDLHLRITWSSALNCDLQRSRVKSGKMGQIWFYMSGSLNISSKSTNMLLHCY